MTDDYTSPQLREISVPSNVHDRWKATAAYLATVNAALVPEVAALAWECTPWALGRCAAAARYIAASEAEPYAGTAKALAVEFEEMAEANEQ
ncbi:MAG: hypothetical protein EKK41_02785 [Hyphomicrobiales bacterium]|nr:MAG: hypothetical protein EKK41_02785 [Hyphomicrobiales bacterium]